MVSESDSRNSVSPVKIKSSQQLEPQSFSRMSNQQQSPMATMQMSYDKFNENLAYSQRDKIKKMAENSHEFRYKSTTTYFLDTTSLLGSIRFWR